MDLESRFHKHKKRFVDTDHMKKAIAGYQIDENGNYLATDGIQALRIKVSEPGDYQILKLNGSLADAGVKKVDVNRFFPELDPRATVDLAAWLDAASAFEAVMKASGAPSDEHGNQLIRLCNTNSALQLSFDLLDGTQGKWAIGPGSEEGFEAYFNGTRLVQCLKVFSGHTEKVDLTLKGSRIYPIMLSAPDIDVLLMPVRAF